MPCWLRPVAAAAVTRPWRRRSASRRAKASVIVPPRRGVEWLRRFEFSAGVPKDGNGADQRIRTGSLVVEARLVL
jgi:hypothetical protein